MKKPADPKKKDTRRPMGSVKVAVIEAAEKGMTVAQIVEKTGITRATVYNCLQRVGITTPPDVWGYHTRGRRPWVGQLPIVDTAQKS